ncbi:MAG: glycosyltransferase, partial [Pseudonocardiaceae bacterium]
SVLAQTRGDWELVVVDNGRSDEIARIVQSYASDPRIRLVRQENRGVAGGVQAAARAARGRYLSVLNSDDQITPGYCARIGSVLDAHPEIDAVTCDAYLFADPGGNELPRTFLESIRARRLAVPQRRITLAEYVRRQHLYHGGMFRRSAWEGVGGYGSEIPETDDLSPDLSLWLRLLTAGCDVRLIPDVLARERIQPTSTSRDPRSIEIVESCAERALLVAARATSRAEDVDAITAALGRLRYQQALRRARHAFLNGDLATARRHAAVGFRQRRTFRSGAILAGLTVAPSALRRLHPVKQRVSAQATRLARTARRVVGLRVR